MPVTNCSIFYPEGHWVQVNHIIVSADRSNPFTVEEAQHRFLLFYGPAGLGDGGRTRSGKTLGQG